MDPAFSSFVLGYHGCDAAVARKVVLAQAPLRHSNNDYDWLGDGVYFWEHNAQRAYDFAVEMSKRPHPSGQAIKTPAVVGAVIDSRYCLNLLDSRFIEMVYGAYQGLDKDLKDAGAPMPVNRGGRDLVDRKLDCAVIRYLSHTREKARLPAFDTVRAAFMEGKPLYENAGFAARTHIQIAVRNPACIVGVFLPRDERGEPRRFG